MGGKGVVLVLLMVVGCGVGTFEEDRAECADKVVGLAGCISYVGGSAKSPTIDCCNGLKQVVEKSMKCLCVLIKDRDNPNLGFKVNATLAATLPSSCNAPTNITHCIDLLKLPPSSPDAKFFAGFANITEPSASSTGNQTSGSRSSAEEKSEGVVGKTSVKMFTSGFALIWLLIFN